MFKSNGGQFHSTVVEVVMFVSQQREKCLCVCAHKISLNLSFQNCVINIVKKQTNKKPREVKLLKATQPEGPILLSANKGDHSLIKSNKHVNTTAFP